MFTAILPYRTRSDVWRHHRAPLLLVMAAAVVWAGCSRSPRSEPTDATDGSAHQAVSNQVTIDNFSYSPAQLTIPVGTTVTWINHDDVPHTVTSTSRPKLFDSNAMDTDDRFTHEFTTIGTFDYFCAVHPHMTGRIIVK
jgi:plastocyanin